MCDQCKDGEICIDDLLGGEVQLVPAWDAHIKPPYSCNEAVRLYIESMNRRGANLPENEWMDLYDGVVSTFNFHVARKWLNTKNCKSSDGLDVVEDNKSVGIICNKCGVSILTVRGVPDNVDMPGFPKIKNSGDDSTSNVGPGHGVPPLRVQRARDAMISELHGNSTPFDCNALALVKSAETLLRLTGLPGRDIKGYEIYLKFAVNDLRYLWRLHVSQSRPACFGFSVKAVDDVVAVVCDGCGDSLRNTKIG